MIEKNKTMPTLKYVTKISDRLIIEKRFIFPKDEYERYIKKSKEKYPTSIFMDKYLRKNFNIPDNHLVDYSAFWISDIQNQYFQVIDSKKRGVTKEDSKYCNHLAIISYNEANKMDINLESFGIGRSDIYIYKIDREPSFLNPNI